MREDNHIATKVSQILKGNIECINEDFVIINNLENLNISTNFPIRLDAVSIGFCFTGEMTLEINAIEHRITPGKLTITLVNDIVQFKSISNDIKGLLLIISKDFLEDSLQNVNDILSLLLYIQKYPLINLSAKECEMIQKFYNFFDEQLNYKHPFPFQEKIVRSILQAFITYITSIFSIDKDTTKHNRNEEIFTRFIHLVIKHYKQRNKLNFYAQQLFLSPRYLCDIIKKTSGHTPREWIDHYTILEAKMLLQTTDLTTEQISYELNFPNSSFFCKFFKKNVGMTTKEYRQSLQ